MAALLARPALAADWAAVLASAKGQQVFWHAWGAIPRSTTYRPGRARGAAGVTLTQVKLASTADAVARVEAEMDAGKTSGGAVDLIWINGENFAAMKARGLLHGPFATDLPNWALVDVAGKPAVATDFTLATEGYESPRALAQLVFESELPAPPKTVAALADWARANPGRFHLSAAARLPRPGPS